MSIISKGATGMGNGHETEEECVVPGWVERVNTSLIFEILWLWHGLHTLGCAQINVPFIG